MEVLSVAFEGSQKGSSRFYPGCKDQTMPVWLSGLMTWGSPSGLLLAFKVQRDRPQQTKERHTNLVHCQQCASIHFGPQLATTTDDLTRNLACLSPWHEVLRFGIVGSFCIRSLFSEPGAPDLGSRLFPLGAGLNADPYQGFLHYLGFRV